MKNRFLVILATTFILFFVLDVLLGSTMFYIVSGGIMGSLSVLSAKEMSIFLAILIWIMLLAGIVLLFFRTQNKPLQFFLFLLIVALLYVVDVVIGQIGEPFMSDSEEIERIATVVKVLRWSGTLLKSIVLSWIIFKGIIKK